MVDFLIKSNEKSLVKIVTKSKEYKKTVQITSLILFSKFSYCYSVVAVIQGKLSKELLI